jgi:hypothetical protein
MMARGWRFGGAPALGVALALSAGCSTLPSDTGPIPSSRPGLTDDTALVPLGSFQVETGVDGGRLAGEDFLSSELLIRYGLHRNVEARVAVASFGGRGSDAPGQALEDLEVSLKLPLRPGGEGLLAPTLALVPFASVPTGADRLSSGTVEPGALLVAEWDLDMGLGLGWTGNFGGTAAKGDDGRFLELFVGGGVGRALSDEVGIEVELVRTAGVGENAPGVGLWHGALGLSWLVHRDAQLDAWGGYRKMGRNDGGFVGVGVSVRR